MQHEKFHFPYLWLCRAKLSTHVPHDLSVTFNPAFHLSVISRISLFLLSYIFDINPSSISSFITSNISKDLIDSNNFCRKHPQSVFLITFMHLIWICRMKYRIFSSCGHPIIISPFTYTKSKRFGRPTRIWQFFEFTYTYIIRIVPDFKKASQSI